MEMADIIRSAAELGAQMALDNAGITSGEISKSEAVRRYGSYFKAAADSGRLLPVRKGSKANSKAYYRVADILALRTADEVCALGIEQSFNKKAI